MKLGRLLTMRHSRGLRSVLIVDEAQGLAHELLEENSMLLNFETYTEKQLQIILAGQPELRQVLNDPALRQSSSASVCVARSNRCGPKKSRLTFARG